MERLVLHIDLWKGDVNVLVLLALFCPIKLKELKDKERPYMTSRANISLNLCVHKGLCVRGPWLTGEHNLDGWITKKNPSLYPSHSSTYNLACARHTQTKTDEHHKQDHLERL